MSKVIIALGSNKGDRLRNLQAAAGLIKSVGKIEKTSSVYESEPWGYAGQKNFYNMALSLFTGLQPLTLLSKLKEFETSLGRKPTFKNGPREIDLDIIFYGSKVINLPELTVPHPLMQDRNFVLFPLYEIAPKAKHPLLEISIEELKSKVPLSGITKTSFKINW
ncbi:2-Amino-4-hydroxy-6- hydroxymethyldihydropteridine pyrophosphokinase [Elusimicrobium minutum Pei191]|uniref:2-amino-4-hydroxy-6-hydroxymethyldihydropteridine pyrophosphokinase n=1 Tax=Elusimicrobium minutum (strain Pei191) TaxID=445932 RepID=B2KCS1_ELUMP|nr:2-amino-4-hydroxy-6-hydroxymethyldihydropteridine diphosphokinase [Elusimicrobium minutum]ACC98317.1 2-Amino-4-hydroxy-6- hydroxymethyldihydropteridine pyrophosphokinase [Elusimicrobium minutum Pei191]